MDERQTFIKEWCHILEWLKPEIPEDERMRRVLEAAEEKYGTKTSPDTNEEK